MNFSEKILFLLMSLALIMALCFLAFVLQDLNDLWAESQELWEMFDDYMTIIKNQDRKIMNLQMQIISKVGVGI
jgi:hypothetical protein